MGESSKQQPQLERRTARNDANDANNDATDDENEQQNTECRNRRNVLQQKYINKGQVDIKKPWKLILQNIQGIVTNNSKKKIDYLKEYTKENQIILINVTETWLDKTIKEDAEIEGYKIFRGDRNEKKKGGAAIYLYDRIEAEQICEQN